MGQLDRWLAGEDIPPAELASARAQEFLATRRARGQRRVPTLRTLVPLFGYLRGRQVVPPEQPMKTPLEALLERYRHHLVHDRGQAPSTVLRHQRWARRFLVQRASRADGEIGVEGLGGAEVIAYLLECGSRLVVASAKREAADLRALLRFFYLEGIIRTDLSAAMPPVAAWRDTRLPATLSAADVAALLGSCDRSQPTGRRDFAILSLLARLGLRSGEVAALQLSDVDWRAGEILVTGKARRVDRLPLPVDVGEALVAYLSDGRPPGGCRHLVLTRYAPPRPINPSSITSVVYRACDRAGLARVGGHRLRHALATEMLRRGGDLVEISQVLRHSDLGTTGVYAKVDRTALRTVALAWPGAVR
jgi:site-specific recombinase XerD